MALQRGDKITNYEGIDFGGNKYALVLDLAPTEGNKILLTLYFPESKTARRYKVPQSTGGTLVKEETPVEKEDASGLSDEVDMLRALSPDRSTKTNRLTQPDSFFPDDPNYPSTITDTLWRPELRWTPFPRFYNVQRRRSSMLRQRTRRHAFGRETSTVGKLFADAFDLDISEFGDEGSEPSLLNLDLNTYVGKECERVIKSVLPLLKRLRTEHLYGDIYELARMVYKLCSIYLYG